MRVLLTTDAVGGVWRYSLELAAAADCEVTLAVLGPAPGAAQRREAGGVRLVETGLGLDWTAPDAETLQAMAQALSALAAAEGADTVQLHAPSLAGAQGWPVPVVAVAHSDIATWWAAMREGPPPPVFSANIAATASGLLRADAVIAPSRAMADALCRAHPDAATNETPGTTGRTIDVVHNGRTSLPVEPGPRQRTVLTAGRLWDEAKGAATLDQAAVGLGAPVRAAGSVAGPNGAAIVLQHLDLLGVLDEAELSAAMSRATVFASPARYEPFGLSVLEAAQSGLALVLSDIPSLRELWDGAALFVPPGDAAALAAALRTALAAPEALATAARQRARRYTAAAMAEATLAVHHRVLAARRSRPDAAGQGRAA